MTFSSSGPRPAPSPRYRGHGKRAIMIWMGMVGFCLVAMVATYLLFVEQPPPRRIVIASGFRSGAYFRFAQQYASELRKDGVLAEVRETAGSVENLRLLGQDDSGVSVAIVQSGVAGTDESGRFVALGSLYREPLWIFHRGEKRLERLSQLEGKRIGVGPQGSGTHAVAMQLLSANGLIDSKSKASSESSRATLSQQNVGAAAAALQKGDLDAAFFVAAFEADYIQDLLKDPRLKLLNFPRRSAYLRRFRFLAPVTLPAGIVDLGRDIPGEDVSLLAPTAMLVARKDFHPALVSLLLTTATRIHENGNALSDPGEFPSASYCDFPISDDARHYYQHGQPVLQRLLPFWLASLADRAKIMLIPLVMLTMPLFRAAPPLMRWRIRRKIYLWYSDLREIDQKLVAGLSSTELERELARLKRIENQVVFVDVPLSYMEEFYHLRLHLAMLQQHLMELRARPIELDAPGEMS